MKKKIVVHFPKNRADQPILYKFVKDFDLIFNVLRARINPDEEGVAVVELIGEEENYKKALKYFSSIGVKIEPLSKETTLDSEKCTMCSACVSHCPTGALYISDRKTMSFAFDKQKCIVCGACVSVCPVNALKIEV